MRMDTRFFVFCPFCGKKLTFSEEDGIFDGKGSSFCPNCGLIHRLPTKKEKLKLLLKKPITMEKTEE